MTMPEAYSTPLIAKSDIAAYLLNRRGRYYRDYGHLLFVFNVKVYDPDLSFEHLLDLHAKSGYGEGKVNDPYWVARQRHAETDQDDLYQMAIEDAGRLVTDSDCFNHLYDGTPVDVEFAFVGRSGGWIALTKFEGIELIDPDHLRDLFNGDQEDGDTPTLSDECPPSPVRPGPNAGTRPDAGKGPGGGGVSSRFQLLCQYVRRYPDHRGVSGGRTLSRLQGAVRYKPGRGNHPSSGDYAWASWNRSLSSASGSSLTAPPERRPFPAILSGMRLRITTGLWHRSRSPSLFTVKTAKHGRSSGWKGGALVCRPQGSWTARRGPYSRRRKRHRSTSTSSKKAINAGHSGAACIEPPLPSCKVQMAKRRPTPFKESITMPARFSLGAVVATPGAIEALANSNQAPAEFLSRHVRGDWGDLDQEDRQLNDEAVNDESRILFGVPHGEGREGLGDNRGRPQFDLSASSR